MKKYQIIDCGAAFEHAGTKATQDVAEIAEKMGFQRCLLRMRTVKESKTAKLQRQIGYYIDWKRCCREIEPDSLLLLQHPFHYPQLIREHSLRKLKEKKVRFICVVHDVEELREFRYNNYYKEEFRFMLEMADVLIVHNAVMKSFFLKKGIKETPLVDLKIFDYLQKEYSGMPPQYDKRLIIAGNLDIRKSAYIGQLWRLPAVSFDLYGGHFENSLSQYSNITYRGVFPADSPSSCLMCGLGLVWDGDSLECCGGPAGEYLRYNNPHKLSLYLSCGLPVVIWEKAAEAAFVREHGVGICVGSLWEMEQAVSRLDEDTYRKLAANAVKTGRRLRDGAYMEQAIRDAQRIIYKTEGKDKAYDSL